MCLSFEIEDKWTVFIEFMIFFIFQGLDVGAHAGVFVMIHEKVTSCANLVSHVTKIPCFKDANGTIYEFNNTMASLSRAFCPSNTLYCSGGANGTATSLDSSQKHLDIVHMVFLAFLSLGALLYVAHLGLLLPNLIKAFMVKDMEVYRENGPSYYRNVLKIHVVFLILETILFDIPCGGIVMEFIAQLWKYGNFNCWECATSLAAVPSEMSLDESKKLLVLTCVGMAFIALYKGMMPLFLWIGNPFCFPCIPLRLVIVLPGGLIALVMTLGPVFGIAERRLIPFAPPVMLAQIKNVGNTFFSIGMIFWGIFGIIGLMSFLCWYRYCREGAEKTADCGCC